MMDKLKRGDLMVFQYTNYKGEHSLRVAIFIDLYYGSNEYHPEEQFIILGYDADKQAERTYTVKDISNLMILKGNR